MLCHQLSKAIVEMPTFAGAAHKLMKTVSTTYKNRYIEQKKKTEEATERARAEIQGLHSPAHFHEASLRCFR